MLIRGFNLATMPSFSIYSLFLSSPAEGYTHSLYPSRYVRWGVHLVFWGLMLLLIRYSYVMWESSEPRTQESLKWLVAGNFLTVMSSHYYLALVSLPLLYGKKWAGLLLSLAGLYIGHTIGNYSLFHYVADQYGIMTKLAEAFGTRGPFYALIERKTLLINWSFTLSPLLIPASVKIVKDVMMARTKALELERDNARLELNFLHAQIQPHFVFNSLNSIYSMVAGVDDEAGNLILRLSDLLRYSLHETAHSRVPLSHEAAFLQGYVNIEAVRQHERTTITYQQEGPLNGFCIPPMILITFVENAFKHGINSTYRQAWADIRLKVSPDGTLSFRVQNSKPVPPPKSRKKSGIGVENTRRRLQLLYPNRHELVIDNQTDAYTVDLTLQLETLPVHSRVISN